MRPNRRATRWTGRQPLRREADYVRFAGDQLAERRSASLPPFAHLALLRAEARHFRDYLASARRAAGGADITPRIELFRARERELLAAGADASAALGRAIEDIRAALGQDR